jgi:hypothetical protein
MVLYRHHISAQTAESPATVGNLPAPAERHDLVPVPAAWPVGTSHLAIAAEVVNRSIDIEVRSDWVASAK